MAKGEWGKTTRLIAEAVGVEGQKPRRSRKATANPTDLLPVEVNLSYSKVVETISNPVDEQLITKAPYGEPAVPCPVCLCEFTHVQAVYTLLGGDEGGSLYRGSHLVARETPYRRDALAVRVSGECGHRWDLVFQQHKGVTLIRIDVLEKQRGEELHLERV